MENTKQLRANKAYKVGLLVNFALTTLICLILTVYYLFEGLPLTNVINLRH